MTQRVKSSPESAAAVTIASGWTGKATIAVYVGTGGTLKVDMANEGDAISYTNVASGSILPISVSKIYSTATGSSVDDVIVLWEG